MSAPERTLLLLRHAKSDYPDGVTDHERPLAPRGIREAELAGAWIGANVPKVDAVLCSTATRTRQTLARTGLDTTAHVRYEDDLYDTTPGTVIRLVDGTPDDVQTLLVVGHEPTMSMLAVGLADPHTSDPGAAEGISSKFPTSAIAVLRFSAPWHALQLRAATLVAFHVPR